MFMIMFMVMTLTLTSMFMGMFVGMMMVFMMVVMAFIPGLNAEVRMWARQSTADTQNHQKNNLELQEAKIIIELKLGPQRKKYRIAVIQF